MFWGQHWPCVGGGDWIGPWMCPACANTTERSHPAWILRSDYASGFLGKKPRTKAPKIQRLVTPRVLQHKRRRIALKKQRTKKNKEEAAEYAKLLAKRMKVRRWCNQRTQECHWVCIFHQGKTLTEFFWFCLGSQRKAPGTDCQET